ncbi:putative phage protein [Oceanisphaera litoralis]|nr:putative phage protein [Oceanisphaera litoralis]
MGMFEARSMRIGQTGGSGLMSREQVVGALGAVSGRHPLGWLAAQAEHGGESSTLAQLTAHLRTRLTAHSAHCATLPELTLAIYLRRPLPEQLRSLVAKHPRWDRERRRAAKLKVLITKEKEKGGEAEAARLQATHDEILTAARVRCEQEIMTTGRCPKCAGTGKMLRKGGDCAVCNGTGKVVPDMGIIERMAGVAAVRAVHQALDELESAATTFKRALRKRLEGEREQ